MNETADICVDGLTKDIAEILLSGVNAPEQEIYRVSRQIAEAALPEWYATGALVRIKSECDEIWHDWVSSGCDPSDAIKFVGHIRDRAKYVLDTSAKAEKTSCVKTEKENE